MDASFTISVDAKGSTVRIAMGGFFERADIARFVEAMRAEQDKLLCGANEHVTLVDIREMMIQSQASVDAFAMLLADTSIASRHIAFVVSVGLAHAQIRRAATGRGAYFADTVEEAEAWLRQRSTAEDAAHPALHRRSRTPYGGSLTTSL